MNHSLAVGLPWGHESIAYFSRSEADRLIVFVHGFGGSAAGTWRGIEKELLSDGRTAESDIVFFGYRSFRSQPEMSAGLLRGFLDDAAGHCRRWKAFRARAGREGAGPEYKEVLIVAHSLGAPVARRAVLDALRDGNDWAERSRLLLFAPAHLGAFLIRLQKQMSGSFGAMVANLLTLTKARILPLDALEPGSPFLTRLLDDSREAFDRGSVDSVRARGVIFGSAEDVVMPGNFLADPSADVWPGHGHCSICRDVETSRAVLEQLD